jgi:hypothetical protein
MYIATTLIIYGTLPKNIDQTPTPSLYLLGFNFELLKHIKNVSLHGGNARRSRRLIQTYWKGR